MREERPEHPEDRETPTRPSRDGDHAFDHARSAFADLVHRYDGRLYNFLLRRTGRPDEAEEIAQEAFARAWERFDQYDPRWQFSTWLYTIAARLVITRRRRRRPLTGVGTIDRVDPGASPSGRLADREDGARLWALADRLLSETQRAALWLRYAEDMPIVDIARVLDRSPVAVRVSLHRARERLAAHERRTPERSTATEAMALGEPVTGGARC